MGLRDLSRAAFCQRLRGFPGSGEKADIVVLSSLACAVGTRHRERLGLLQLVEQSDPSASPSPGPNGFSVAFPLNDGWGLR